METMKYNQGQQALSTQLRIQEIEKKAVKANVINITTFSKTALIVIIKCIMLFTSLTMIHFMNRAY